MRNKHEIFKRQYQIRASLGSTAEWLAGFDLGDGWHVIDLAQFPNQIHLRFSFEGLRNLIEIEAQSTAQFNLIGDVTLTLTGWRWEKTGEPVDWLEADDPPTLEVCHLIDQSVHRQWPTLEPPPQRNSQAEADSVQQAPAPPSSLPGGRRSDPLYDQAYIELYTEKKYRTAKEAFCALVLPNLGDIDAAQISAALKAFKQAMYHRRVNDSKARK